MNVRRDLLLLGLAFGAIAPLHAQDVESARLVTAAEKEVARQVGSYKTQVGTRYAGSRTVAGLRRTDCFIFTGSVIANALAAVGRTSDAAAVRKLTQDGGDVAKYLVEKLGWTSWYWNPDVRHPADLEDKHIIYAAQAARQRKHFYLGPRFPTRFVPIQRYLVNYDPVPEADYQRDVRDYRVTNANLAGVEAVRRNRFCFGITEGSLHTFLVMKGKAVEVHWDAYGPDAPPATAPGEGKLYEISDFFADFSNYRMGGWLSGVLVCSPDPQPLPASTVDFDRG